jgi:hypothetical protein
VYVVVFADNVGDWGATPTEDERKRIEDTVSVADDGSLVPDPSGSEPTNDVYVVFKPGCQRSSFYYVTKRAGYDNHVLLDGETLFVANGRNQGKTFTGPGVTCAG